MTNWKPYGAWTAWIVMIVCYAFGGVHIGLASIDMKGTDWDPKVVKLLRSVFGGQQEHLFWGIGFIIVALIAQITERFLKPLPEDNLTFGPQGEAIQTGTLESFLQEITESAKEIAREAKNYFVVALNELSKGKFRMAATNFYRSVKNAPTMSGYLNLGVSQYFCTDWLNAEKSFRSGLEIAERLKNELFQARFFNNLGLLKLHTGSLSDARRYFDVDYSSNTETWKGKLPQPGIWVTLPIYWASIKTRTISNGKL
jgi:hypothetical protein